MVWIRNVLIQVKTKRRTLDENIEEKNSQTHAQRKIIISKWLWAYTIFTEFKTFFFRFSFFFSSIYYFIFRSFTLRVFLWIYVVFHFSVAAPKRNSVVSNNKPNSFGAVESVQNQNQFWWRRRQRKYFCLPEIEKQKERRRSEIPSCFKLKWKKWERSEKRKKKWNEIVDDMCVRLYALNTSGYE